MFNWSDSISALYLAMFIAYIVFAVIQFYYLFRIYFPAAIYKSDITRVQVPLSVIICARNEAENLDKNLRAVLSQNYKEFEVIVVNDCSTDHSDEILGNYLNEFKNLKITNIPLDRKFSHGKKLALTVGIKSAQYEHLVFTDADCKPESPDWLLELSCGFSSKDILLGYGGYYRKKSLLNNYIRYDTLTIALTYMGFALAKKPYMGVGRNLAYKKQLFFDNKGFARNYGISSGDDDLFINEVATKSNVAVINSPNSFTRSEAEGSLGKLFKQKMRHLSTAKSYKSAHVFMLGLEPVSRAWFYLLFLLLLVFKVYWILTLCIFGVRFISQLFLYIVAGKKFKENNLWLSYFIFDVYALFFNFAIYLTLSLRRKKIRWK